MPHQKKPNGEKTHSIFGVALLYLGLLSVASFLIGRYSFGWSRLGFVCHMLMLLAACGLACAPLWLHRTKALGRNRAEKFSRIAVVSLLSTELMFNLLSFGMTTFAGVPVNVWMVAPYVLDPHQTAKAALLAAAIIAGWSTVFWAMWRLWPRVGRSVSSPREPNLSVRLSGMSTVVCLVLIVLIPNRWWQAEEVTKFFSKSSTGDHVPFGISDILSEAQRQKEEIYRNRLLFEAARELPVVLITVDALRPDQMGVYDPEKSTTPFLSRQAAQGLLRKYDHAFSVCTASNCGLTGLVKSQSWDKMNVHSLGLMEALSALDYELTSILSGDHSNFFELRTAYGSEIKTFFDGTLSRDFDLNDDRSVLANLRLLPSPIKSRQFYHFHLMSAHSSGIKELEPEETIWKLIRSHLASDRKTMERVKLRYETGVVQADETIRKIFSELDELGILQDALVILTADHGEFLGEHGRIGHGGPLTNPLSMSPYWYGGAAVRPGPIVS